MNKLVRASGLIAVIVAAAGWVGVTLRGQSPPRPDAGLFQRSKVDGSGHARGIVQVDLMRRIMADKARAAPEAVAAPAHRVPSQDHPLLGRPAPPLALEDVRGEIGKRGDPVSDGPIVVVFTLGFRCVACVTHLVELDVATPRFRARGARVLAVSGDRPEFARGRLRRFGGFQIALLSDPDHAASRAYGVWKPLPDGGEDDGEMRHGTFIVDRAGALRWAHVGDRPFRDVEALLAELDRMRAPAAE